VNLPILVLDAPTHPRTVPVGGGPSFVLRALPRHILVGYVQGEHVLDDF
jgi:hypothetical protein